VAAAAGGAASGFLGAGAGVAVREALGAGVAGLSGPGFGALATGAGVAGLGEPAEGVAGAAAAGLGEPGAGVAGLPGGGVCAVPVSAARSGEENDAQPKSAASATVARICFLKKGIIGMLPCEWGRGRSLRSAQVWGLIYSIINYLGANKLGIILFRAVSDP